MIVDGICVQFFGCFDYGHKTEKHSDSSTQQIIGVGRIELDEEYYRELSSAQVCFCIQTKLFLDLNFFFRFHQKMILNQKIKKMKMIKILFNP
jgi:hypothetical protein